MKLMSLEQFIPRRKTSRQALTKEIGSEGILRSCQVAMTERETTAHNQR